MKKYLNILKKTPLFSQISNEEIETVLKCLGAIKQNYSKNQFIIMAGDDVSLIGIMLSGSVQIIKEDIMGNRSILANLSEGEMFGEAFAFAGMKKSLVTVVATEESKVLFIDYRKLLHPCESACMFHTKLIDNMIKIIATKNLELTTKMDILSQKTTREKLMAYLSIQMKKNQKRSFEISFSREELADYLCVNRSALSRELSKMKEEGILLYERKNFQIM